MSNLHHLRILDAVACAGSITRGADRLMVSQPAVSKQLKQLERSLKQTLYRRTATGIELTPAGKIAAEHARRIVALAEGLPGALADLTSLRAGVLRVAATPTLGTYLLPEVLIRFRRKYPGIVLTFDLQPLALVLARLATGDLDFAITDQPTESVHGKSVWSDDVLPIVSAGHRLAGRRKVALKSFLGEALILQEAPEPMPRVAGVALRAALTLPTVEAVKRAVAAGLGVALLPRYTVRAELGSGLLATVGLRERVEGLRFYELRPVGRADSKPVVAFGYLIKHAVKGILGATARGLAVKK